MGACHHDLYDFMQQLSAEMSAEYARIQKRAADDPGTAGDQGEKNWAKLLEDWLPRTFKVVTKGRIIGENGATSGHIDVLVLHGAYPKKLLDKKLYLAAGVAAAFECKTTLTASHVAEAVEKSIQVKNLFAARRGTPYKELHSPMVYGLLAHSHSWKGANSSPEQNIARSLHEAERLHADHPRLLLDLLCVADLAAWTSSVMTLYPLHQIPQNQKSFHTACNPPSPPASAYLAHSCTDEKQIKHFTPIGVLISYLSQKLAWENPSLRPLADYYRMANISGQGKGCMRVWSDSIYSKEVSLGIRAGFITFPLAFCLILFHLDGPEVTTNGPARSDFDR